jgi:alpha-glucosidase (family GH31 glycosyl hydrolase)
VLEAWSDERTFYIWNGAKYTPKPGSDAFCYTDFHFPADGMWPDPKGMVEKLHKKGLHILLWQIPVLKENQEAHIQLANDRKFMLDQRYCVHTETGTPYLIRPFWFHNGLLMDFTNQKSVDWWMRKRAYLFSEIGIDGFKTDGGEHIWGRDLIFADGRKSDQIWNEYPNLYVGAYYQFAREYKTDAITFSRSGYTGAQAFPCHWAGDENSTWEAFQRTILAGLNLGVSGVAFWGWDMAGFSGKIPSAELYLRAAAMVTFCPIMQYHSEFNHHRQPSNDRTPWNIAERTKNPDVVQIFRFFARLRMNLLPYILHEARRATITGLPMMRMLSIVYPHEKKLSAYPYQYLFGDTLLVAPIVKPNLLEIKVYLPKGEWYSLWDSQLYNGETEYALSTSLFQIPVFVRANSILPLNLDDTFLLGCNVGNRIDAWDKLCFKFYPGKSGVYNWHDDAMKTEIRFSWEQASLNKYILRIHASLCPLHILLPKGYFFDVAPTEIISGEQMLSLVDTTKKQFEISVYRETGV